jgi:hypothetical protein
MCKWLWPNEARSDKSRRVLFQAFSCRFDGPSLRMYQFDPHWTDYRDTCYRGTPNKTLARKPPQIFFLKIGQKCRTLYMKVKRSHYMPGQAHRVPGVWGSQISRQSSHEGCKVVSLTHRPPLPPGNFCFWVVLCIVFLCRSVYCLCVNVYWTAATGCQPNCSLTNISISDIPGTHFF